MPIVSIFVMLCCYYGSLLMKIGLTITEKAFLKDMEYEVLIGDSNYSHFKKKLAKPFYIEKLLLKNRKRIVAILLMYGLIIIIYFIYLDALYPLLETFLLSCLNAISAHAIEMTG